MSFMKGPKVPTPTAPPEMPTPDDDAIKAAKRRAVASQNARSGRDSTILSDREGL